MVKTATSFLRGRSGDSQDVVSPDRELVVWKSLNIGDGGLSGLTANEIDHCIMHRSLLKPETTTMKRIRRLEPIGAARSPQAVVGKSDIRNGSGVPGERCFQQSLALRHGGRHRRRATQRRVRLGSHMQINSAAQALDRTLAATSWSTNASICRHGNLKRHKVAACAIQTPLAAIERRAHENAAAALASSGWIRYAARPVLTN
jgi:hypothetical protein